MDDKKCYEKCGALRLAELTRSARQSERSRAPALLTALALLVAGTGGCSKAPENKVPEVAAAPNPQTTGRLVVKSNLATTTLEVTPNPSGGQTGGTRVRGPIEGAAEQVLAGLPAGEYILTAHSAGWPDIRQEVRVYAGRTNELTINFKSGSLHLESDPSGTTVRLGATVLGQTPLTIPQLPIGKCQFTLEYPTWPMLQFETTIAENEASTATVRLPHGKLIVETTPPGTTVLLAGKILGQTPLTVDLIPVGLKKLTLQAKDFPTLEVTLTVKDREEAKINQPMAFGFPELDPPALLQAVWVPKNPDKIAPSFDSITGLYQPQNGVVRNLHRKRLFENWLRKNYRLSATIKSYDQTSGQIEFTEQASELAKYRVLAWLSPSAQDDQNLVASLVKGATCKLYGRLSAVEEPRWPAKVITFELSPAEPLR